MIIIVWSIMKNYKNFLRHTIFQITYAMCSTSIFSCIMTMISNFTIFFIFQIFVFKFFLQIQRILAFSYDSCCSFVNNFIFFFLKSIIFIACSLKNSHNSRKVYIQSLLLHTSCLFSMFLNEVMVLTLKVLMEYVCLLLL